MLEATTNARATRAEKTEADALTFARAGGCCGCVGGRGRIGGMMSFGLAGAPGSSCSVAGGVPWGVGCCPGLGTAGEALKPSNSWLAALGVDISLKPNGCLCGSLHCLDLLVVGSLDSS